MSSIIDKKTDQLNLFNENQNIKDKALKQIWYNIQTLFEKNPENGIFIRGNAPSLKNSKEIVSIKIKKCVCGGQIQITPHKKDICTSCNNPRRKTMHSLVPSKAVKKYIKETTPYWMKNQHKFIQRLKTLNQGYPIILGMYFIRDSKRRFDYINAMQIIQDLMTVDWTDKNNRVVVRKYIEDDDMTRIFPVCMGYHVNPKSAGTIMIPLGIEVLKTISLFGIKPEINNKPSLKEELLNLLRINKETMISEEKTIEEIKQLLAKY